MALGLGLAAPVLDLLGVIDPLAFFDGLPFRVPGLAMGPCYSPNVLERLFDKSLKGFSIVGLWSL